MKKTVLLAIALLFVGILLVYLPNGSDDRAIISNGRFDSSMIATAYAQGPTYELACPAGTQPLPFGTTYNPTTNKYRAWVCSDPFGTVTTQGTLAPQTPILAPNGTAAAPSYSFLNETGSGLYRIGVADIGFSITGTLTTVFDAGGVDVIPGALFRWCSASNCAGVDTGFSRISAGTVGIGNGNNGSITGNLQLNLITSYGGTTTVGNGVPSIVYNTGSSTSSGNQGATMIASTPSAGNYEFAIEVRQIGAGVGCTTNSTITPSITFTDPTIGAQTFTFAQLTITTNGTASTVIAMYPAVDFQSNTSTLISWSTVFVSGTCTTAPTYNIIPVLKRL